MKNYLLFTFISCFFASQTSAQTNLDFEDWTNQGAYDDPTGWITMNFAVSIGGSISCAKHKPHWGNHSMRISHSEVPGVGTIAGFAVQQFECTKRPKSFSFYYIYKGSSLDSATVSISFTKGYSGDPQNTIGETSFILSNAPDWTMRSADILWKNGMIPDSATILIANSTTSIKDTLYIDDLSISMWGVPVSVIAKPDYHIYLDRENHLVLDPSLQKKTLGVTIRNNLGQTVFTQQSDMETIDLCQLPEGIYVYEIMTENHHPVTGKFVR